MTVQNPTIRRFRFRSTVLASIALILAGCSGGPGTDREDVPQFPVNPDRERQFRHGRLTGEGKGFTLFGGDDSAGEAAGASPIGVNSFLWQATLDTLTFMPIASADPFGGVILTDWYEDPDAEGERFKVTALILGRSLRTDAIKMTVHKQALDENNLWRDRPVNADVARKLEDTVLTRARELRVLSDG